MIKKASEDGASIYLSEDIVEEGFQMVEWAYFLKDSLEEGIEIFPEKKKPWIMEYIRRIVANYW
jgi:hypothetical protein